MTLIKLIKVKGLNLISEIYEVLLLNDIEESTIIERIARTVVRNRMEVPVIFYLESTKPSLPLQAAMGIMFIAPFLEAFGIRGYTFFKLFMRPENIDKLITRIKELAAERDAKDK